MTQVGRRLYLQVPLGGGNDVISQEQIQQAVNAYLEDNPVSGMTDEQVQQLNQVVADVAEKLNSNFGSDNAGKYLVVGNDGEIIVSDAPVISDDQVKTAVNAYLEENPPSGVEIDDTLTQEGKAADAKITGEAIGSLEDNFEKVNKRIEETWKDVIIGELFEDESEQISELPYKKEGLDTYINFAYYPDGFPGKFGDLSENNTDVITNGTDLYTSGRNGMVDGKFMVNGGPLSNSQGSRIVIASEAIHAYPFSVEMYVHLRRDYNPYAGNGVLNYTSTDAIQNYQAVLFSTQYKSDGTSTNGVKVMINKENVSISGSANSPNVSKNVPGLEIDGIQNENIGDRYDHIVVCFDSNNQKLYLNKELVIDNDEKSVSLTMSSVLRILPDALKGDIKLIRIYEGILSDDDVAMNYSNAVGGAEDEI